MIRFSAVLVAVAVGILVGGIATSKLLLVYVAIGLSAAALVALAIGVVLKRAELFGEAGSSPAPAAAGASTEEPRLPGQNQVPQNGRVDSPGAPLPAAGSAASPPGQFQREAGGSRDQAAAQGGQGAPGFGSPGYGQPAPGRPQPQPQSQPQPAFGQASFTPVAAPGKEAQPGHETPAREPAARGDWTTRNVPAQETPATPAWGAPGRDKAAPWDAPAREAAAWNAPAWDAPPREAPTWQPPQPLGTARPEASPDAPPPDAPPPAVPPERPGHPGRDSRSAGPFRSGDLWGPPAPAAPLSPEFTSGSAAPPAPPRADRPSRSYAETFGSPPPAPAPAAPPSWFDRPARLRRDAEEERSAVRDAGSGDQPAPARAAAAGTDTTREAPSAPEPERASKPTRDAEASPKPGGTADEGRPPKDDPPPKPDATPKTGAPADAAAPPGPDATLEADQATDAEATSKAGAAPTAAPRDETQETGRSKATFQVDSTGSTEASAAESGTSTTPAAAATREASSGSADAEPDERSGTAKPEPAAASAKAEPANAEPADDETAAADTARQQRQVTVVPGVPRYHTDDCILIRFMEDDDVQQMSLMAATEAGCTPCGACQPDD